MELEKLVHTHEHKIDQQQKYYIEILKIVKDLQMAKENQQVEMATLKSPMCGFEEKFEETRRQIKEHNEEAKKVLKKEIHTRFDERIDSLHALRTNLIEEMSSRIESEFKKEISNLSKKITMLVELQRKRFKDFEEMMAKTNVRVDALTKRDLKRQQQLKSTNTAQLHANKSLE